MRTVRPAVVVAVAAAFAWSLAAGASPAGRASLSPGGDTSGKRVTAVPPAGYAPADVTRKSAQSLLAPGTAAHRVLLGAPTAAERAALEAGTVKRGSRVRDKSAPLIVGFPRAVPAASRALALPDLAWTPMPDGGRVARIEIQSPGAAALRVSLTLPAVHPDLALRFAGNAARAPVHGPYPANAIAAAIARDGRYWSPVLEGDTATIELHAPAGVPLDGVMLRLGPLSHLVVAGDALGRVATKRESDIGDSSPCNIDIACVTPPSTALTQAANSVGKLLISDLAGRTRLCSGTMLSDSVRSFTPYFLTASHCMDDGFLPGTVNVYWFFRAQSCGSLAVPPYVLQTGGSFLLARSTDYEWMLLRLNRPAPAGVFFSAWNADPLPALTPATGLHHPEGDLAKYSHGSTQGYEVYADGSTFIKMLWTQGTTEAGSSGSGLFTFFTPGGYYEVRGSLFGGEAACTNPGGIDVYSRLDNMLPLTRQYLTPDQPALNQQAVAVEYYHRLLDHYFITIDSNEINLLDTGVLSGWERTGFRFLAYAAPSAGANPVCRFYLRPELGDSHFYSGDPAECARVRTQFAASWIEEGASVFYIQLPDPTTSACPAGTRPVWRFLNSRKANHRYTAEVLIRDELRADPNWVAEGYGPDAVIMCSPTSN